MLCNKIIKYYENVFVFHFVLEIATKSNGSASSTPKLRKNEKAEQCSHSRGYLIGQITTIQTKKKNHGSEATLYHNKTKKNVLLN